MLRTVLLTDRINSWFHSKGFGAVLNMRVFMSWAELPKWIIVFYVLCTVSSQDTDTGHARNVSADLSFCLTFPSMPSTSFQTGLQDNSCLCLPITWSLTQSCAIVRLKNGAFKWFLLANTSCWLSLLLHLKWIHLHWRRRQIPLTRLQMFSLDWC